MSVLNANEQEKQSTKRTPTETKMAVLMSVKEKMLHTSKLYLRVGQTKTERNCKAHRPIVHSSVALTTK